MIPPSVISFLQDPLPSICHQFVSPDRLDGRWAVVPPQFYSHGHNQVLASPLPSLLPSMWSCENCETGGHIKSVNETSDQSETMKIVKIVTTEHSLISDPGGANNHSSIVKVIQSDRCATESQKQKKGKIYNRESFSCAWWLQFRILFTLQHKEVISIHWDWDQSNSTDSQATIGEKLPKMQTI